MRNSIFLHSAVLFLAAVSPAVVCAQFQQPTPEELTMTSDPKAPGADAVFLEIRESDNDPMHDRRYYARIKVLTEKGKELATVQLPYIKGVADFKIVDIQGRTIHSDGTVIPLTVNPANLLVAKTGEAQVQKKVFTLPSVEVGSVLEYSYELTYDNNHFSSPEWEIQRRYFVHKAHYDFSPFKAFVPGTQGQSEGYLNYLIDEYGNNLDHLVWWWRLPNGLIVAQEPSLGRFSLDVADIPPIPDEAWMPPPLSLLYRVLFYYTYAASAEDFWGKAAKSWSKEIDQFAEPNKTIRDAAAGLVAPSDSDLVKAQKLYNAVEALDNTNYSRQKTESERKELKLKPEKHAADTWTQKSGNSNELALLYLAMLRAAGLTAHAISVVDRDRGVFDPSYMSLDQLDDTLVILSTGGKEILLDPGEKMCPFATVSWKHSGAEGLRQSADGPGRATTPSQVFGANTVKRTSDLTVDRQGGINGTLQIVMTGQEALRWRQTALDVDASELKKQFDRGLEDVVPEGVDAHVDRFLGLDEPDRVLMAFVHVKGTLGTATAKRLILPGFFFHTRGGEPFVSRERRMEPVDMQYAGQITDQVTYDLPADMTLEGVPQDAKVSWEGHAVYIVKTKSEPGQITVARLLANAFTQAKPEEYPDLRGFYQKVAAADQVQLVLAIAPAGKSN
jgi:hypothetical protein